MKRPVRRSAIFQTLLPLYLASGSPRRIAFLADLGLRAVCLSPPENAEPSPLPGESPPDFALRAARAKAAAATAMLSHQSDTKPAAPPRPSAAILAADTIVVLEGEILGKPDNPDHAFAMLSRLAGVEHSVITGCVIQPVSAGRETAPGACCSPEPPSVAFSVQSRVRMWDCPEALLKAYARCGEPLDKAGAYAVQGIGAFLVREIQGSWSNVVGLPLAELVQALLDLRFIAPLVPPGEASPG